MMRVSIVGAFAVALALSAISAQAQQISACVNNSTGAIRIVAPNTSCSTTEHKLIWAGTLAGADFQCNAGQLINANEPLTFGSAISSTGTSPFSSFVLQQGMYQIHLSGSRFGITPGHNPYITGMLNPPLVNAPFWELTVPISQFCILLAAMPNLAGCESSWSKDPQFQKQVKRANVASCRTSLLRPQGLDVKRSPMP
jgi:hypothetical protein